MLDEPTFTKDLTSYFRPVGDARDIVLAQKVALREVNAHALVNATTRLSVPEILVVEHGVIAYGGIAPVPVAGPANGGGDHGAPAGTSSLLRHAPFARPLRGLHPEGLVMGRLRGEGFAREPHAKAEDVMEPVSRRSGPASRSGHSWSG